MLPVIVVDAKILFVCLRSLFPEFVCVRVVGSYHASVMLEFSIPHLAGLLGNHVPALEMVYYRCQCRHNISLMDTCASSTAVRVVFVGRSYYTNMNQSVTIRIVLQPSNSGTCITNCFPIISRGPHPISIVTDFVSQLCRFASSCDTWGTLLHNVLDLLTICHIRSLMIASPNLCTYNSLLQLAYDIAVSALWVCDPVTTTRCDCVAATRRRLCTRGLYFLRPTHRRRHLVFGWEPVLSRETFYALRMPLTLHVEIGHLL